MLSTEGGRGEGHWDDSKRALLSEACLVIGSPGKTYQTYARQKGKDGGLRKDCVTLLKVCAAGADQGSF